MRTAFLLGSLISLTFTTAQSLVQEAPPPPTQRLSTTKSGVLPILPTATAFSYVDTLQGAIISPVPAPAAYTPLGGLATSQTAQPVATYVATLNGTMFNPLVGSVVQGTIQAVGTANGTRFTVNLTGLPSQSAYGPFAWHIHQLAVPADGNCTATLGHLDPTNSGEYYMCNPAVPASCQVGDLAGKHGGKIATQGNFSTSFVDAFVSTVAGKSAFLGGLGFVLHTANTSRIACANFLYVRGANGTATNGSATASATGTGAPQFTGAAGKVMVGAGAVMGGLLALLL